jgi:hypothetical protein
MAPTDAIRAMRESSEYEAFERKWQLPVYFQLRWKEIVGPLDVPVPPATDIGEWKLAQTHSAWKAISTCWHPDVFLPELAPRFWRLSLQVGT